MAWQERTQDQGQPLLLAEKDSDCSMQLCVDDLQISDEAESRSRSPRSRKSWLRTTAPALFTHTVVFILTSVVWALPMYLASSHQPTANCPSFMPATAKSVHDNEVSVTSQESTTMAQVSASPKNGNFTSTAQLLTCGHSTTEAKALGCRYDILSNHWVPSICMDDEAVAEYQSDGTWHGFSDPAHTELLEIAEMGDKDFYYTNERDHIVHCAMLWRKQFRAFYEERSHIDTLIGSVEHTMHCSQFLIDMTEKGPDYRNMPIKTFVGYAGCWVRE